jgi:hypothetical protein
MSNYTTINNQIKRIIMNFGEKVTKGTTKPTEKFIHQMLFGIMASSSLHLSKIARALKEDTHLNQTINRLSLNLEKVDLKVVWDNYLNTLKPEVDDDTIFCVDDSEVIKPLGTHFEDLGYVKDGSNNDKTIEKGYHANEIVMIGKSKQPKSVYSNLYSEKESGFVSSNTETFKGLNTVINNFGKVGTYVMDRGYDADKYYQYFIDNQINFIIRSKKNRKVIYKGKKRSIDYVINNYKGKINMNLTFQKKQYQVRVSHAKVKLLGIKEPLNLVVVHGMGKEVFKLLTNKEIKGKEDVIKIVRSYLSRWRIEEYFKFKKQQYGFEDFRVRSLKKIRNLNILASLTISIVSGLVKQEDSVLINNIKEVSQGLKAKVFFWLYRIADGITKALANSATGINNLLLDKRKAAREYNLFTLFNINLDLS